MMKSSEAYVITKNSLECLKQAIATIEKLDRRLSRIEKALDIGRQKLLEWILSINTQLLTSTPSIAGSNSLMSWPARYGSHRKLYNLLGIHVNFPLTIHIPKH